MSVLTELQKIRNNFQTDLRNWFDIAHALIATASIGSDKVVEYMQSNPDSYYSFAVPININESQTFASINKLQYQKIFEIYFNHKGAIAELVYGRIIQQWYDFLNQIIEQIVKEHITGVKNYPKIPKLKVEIDFSIENFLEEIPRLARENFDFYKGTEKTKNIETSLEQNLDKELKQQIKKAIIVRNLLEHNHGIVRDKDRAQTGTNSIKLIDNSCQEKDFKTDEKVQITIYELFRLKQVLYHAAKELIPD